MSITNESLTVIEKGWSIVVQTSADYMATGSFVQGCKTLIQRIKLHYRGTAEAPGPILQADRLHAALIEAEKSQIQPLQEVIDHCITEMIGYENREKARAAEEQAKLQARADKKGGSAAPQIQVTPDIPVVEGVSNRDNWKAVVDNVALLPVMYLMPDQKLLDAAAKRMKDKFNVPGAHSVNFQNKAIRT